MKATCLPINRSRDAWLLACRCGRALRPHEMHWFNPPRPVAEGTVVIRQICCLQCAVSAGHIDGHDAAGAA